MAGIIIKNLVIIGVILGVAVLSQQPYFNSATKHYVYSNGTTGENKYLGAINNYFQKAGSWVRSFAYEKVSGEVAKREELAKEEINKSIGSAQDFGQKNNILEKSFDASKKFIAGKVLNILGVKPEDLHWFAQNNRLTPPEEGLMLNIDNVAKCR